MDSKSIDSKAFLEGHSYLIQLKEDVYRGGLNPKCHGGNPRLQLQTFTPTHVHRS